MSRLIAQAEKIEIMLALGFAFELKFGTANTETSGQEIADKIFSFLSEDEKDLLNSRIEIFDSLAPQNKQIWQAHWLDKIRRRGRAIRLDEQINPAQIVKVLLGEPESIQSLILRHLQKDLGEKIALNLAISSNFGTQQDKPEKIINSEIFALIREKFLSFFVALEDLFEPNELDRFSIAQLSEFIRHLAIRETAVACRGIKSKETLAAFLNIFNEEDAIDIARNITDLEKINTFWVKQADDLVRQIWDEKTNPDKFLNKIGLKLLSIAFVGSDEKRIRYTAQKLTPYGTKKWLGSVAESEAEYLESSEEQRIEINKRIKIIERLSKKYAEAHK